MGKPYWAGLIFQRPDQRIQSKDTHYPLSNMHIHRKLIIPVDSHTVNKAIALADHKKVTKPLIWAEQAINSSDFHSPPSHSYPPKNNEV